LKQATLDLLSALIELMDPNIEMQIISKLKQLIDNIAFVVL